MLHAGLYEQVINRQPADEPAQAPEARRSAAPVGRAEASGDWTIHDKRS